MKTYTIDQIRNYLLSQDSMGDILYNLSEESIDKANVKSEKHWSQIQDNTYEYCSRCNGECECFDHE